MNPNNLHTPERLEGEAFDEYRARRRMAARVVDMGGSLKFKPTALRPQVKSTYATLAKRQLLAEVGPRQARKLMRAARAQMKSAGGA